MIKDCRDENPKLHALYVRWATEHLIAARRCIEYMESFSNWSASEFSAAMQDAENKLISENAAYKEASDFLNMLQSDHGVRFKNIRIFSEHKNFTRIKS